jgi:hypothetical protein
MYVRYNVQLTKVMERLLLVSEVAYSTRHDATHRDLQQIFFGSKRFSDLDAGLSEGEETLSGKGQNCNERDSSPRPATQLEMLSLLDEWDEPSVDSNEKELVSLFVQLVPSKGPKTSNVF